MPNRTTAQSQIHSLPSAHLATIPIRNLTVSDHIPISVHLLQCSIAVSHYSSHIRRQPPASLRLLQHLAYKGCAYSSLKY